MDPNEKTIYEHMISEYQQALADAQLGLARANGMIKVKDQAISQMLAKIEELDPTPDDRPKPGPPPAR